MTTTPHALQQATFTLEQLYCTGCADAVERALRANPHIASVHLDWPNNRVQVSYHDGMIDEATIAALIAATGCDCTAEDGHAAHTMPEPQRRFQHLKHGVDVQPITLSTKQDRMQYELPATGADPARRKQAAAASGGHETMDHGSHDTMDHSGHAMPGQAAAAAVDHSSHAGMKQNAMDHSAHQGMEHRGHAGMDHSSHDMSDLSMAAAMERDMRNKFFVALPLTLLTVLYSPLGERILGFMPPTFGIDMNLLMLLLATPVVFYSGWMFISGAYHSLKRGALNMSVLVATGVLAAYGGSLVLMLWGGEVFFEAAAMLVTFVLFGHWMEMRSRRGMNDAMRALFDLVPPQATVIRNGEEQTIPSSAVVVGDTVVLKPGDKVPVDGRVVSGESSIDESLVTGESVPVSKRVGDEVIAGSINASGSLRFEATKVGADTTLAQIADLVQKAQASKAPGQRLADRAAQYLVILAVGAGLVTFLVWLGVFGAPLAVALTFAISAVVIACPDALGLATPTAVAVGTGVAARHNILIKDAATLEGLAGIKAIVLDKTGTLTAGKPALTDVTTTGLVPEGELLRLVASAERGSEHPLAEAIVVGAQARGLALADATQFESIAGHGIRAVVDGRTLLVGNRKLMADSGIDAGALEEQAASLAEGGKTPMFVAVGEQAAGLIAVADTIKPTSAEAIRRFGELGIEAVMITGDNARTAQAVAKELGIARFFAEVLPADKARHVQALQGEGKQVAMVGDGVNDAPALAQANIGIAIGAGTDVAIQTANVVLMQSDPLDIVDAITISQATVRKMKQNLFWAAIYNVLAIPVAAGVLYPAYGIALRPEWAALLMSLSSIIVALNAVALKGVEGRLSPATETRPAAPLKPVSTT
jgi:P-type Cu2+ transporter